MAPTAPATSRRTWLFLPAALGVLGIAAAVSAGGAFAWVAALAAVGMAVACLRFGSSALAGQMIPYAASVAVLGICGAGLDQAQGVQSWRSVAAVAAYPFLIRALRGIVVAHR